MKFNDAIEPELNQVLKAGIAEKDWVKIDNAGEQCNNFVFEVESILREFCHPIEKQISGVFFSRVMNGLCTLVNDRIVYFILGIKKVSESGGIQLLCGKKQYLRRILNLIFRFYWDQEKTEENLQQPTKLEKQCPISILHHQNQH